MERINVSDIQHFTVGDGPGIRTTVFLKGCNLRCPWCHNPETWSPEPQILRYENTGHEQRCGIKLSVEEIVAEVASDRDFYSESGGGATLSGGEAMLQSRKVAALAQALKKEGISVWIDTAGSVPYSAFQMTNPFTDGYLLDYKTDDPRDYARIGGDALLIRQNIRKLLDDSMELRIRIPLIPGFNADGESLRSIRDRLGELGVKSVDLIPFHRLGSGKYKALGMIYPYEGVLPLTKEQIEEIREIFSKDFQTTIE